MSLDPGTEMKRPSYKYFLRGVLNRMVYLTPQFPPAERQYPRLWYRCLTLSVFVLFFLYICKVGLDLQTCDVGEVNHAHMKRAQMFARDVLQAQCRPDFAKNEMGRLFKDRYSKDLSCFVKRDDVLNDSMYKFRPPFGFRNNLDDLENLLEIMPEDSLPKGLESKNCKRCIVVGSGGILHGLDLGQSIDQFDIVIRLNNAPIQGFSTSVGNKTTIRMTYPEGAPFSEKEYIPNSLFVTVLFKNADFRWLQAVLKNESLSAWNRLFFWKRVPVKLPLSSTQFRILNPLIVKETAFDVLKYPEPQRKWLGWEKNVPTIGVMAVILATHLCDEVSIAGFGYDLSQPHTPLHYYDNLCMNAMNRQPMHDVTKEKQVLQTLMKEGIVTDLSGGIHCHFCDVQHHRE